MQPAGAAHRAGRIVAAGIGLRRQLAYVILATATMVALAFLIPLALLVAQLAEERAVADAERQVAVVAAVLAITTQPAAVEEAIASDDLPVTVHGLAGVQLGASGHATVGDVTLARTSGDPLTGDVPGGMVYLEPIDIGKDAAPVVEVFLSDAVLSEGVHAAWAALTGVAVFLIVVSVAVGDRLARNLVRSADRLARASVALGEGDPDVRISPTGPRELAEAALAFNRMADRLAVLRTNEREMVADLSHRLRTPLTVIRLDLETLDRPVRSAREEDDRLRTVHRVRDAAEALEGEIDELIRATRAASVEPAPTAEVRCDAGEVVRQRMAFWSAVAGDQNRPCVIVGADAPAPVALPRPELAAALDAVLGNVFRYTPQGTPMEVAVSRRDGYVAVRVDDGGPGIADPDTAVRRGASGRGSTGLGLDIARRATVATGGTVSIDRARLGGASVVLLFGDPDAVRQERVPRQRRRSQR
ncbi:MULTISPECIES: HAMP domain-containing sensor histidine kinase [Catenuloplanes]|uniref:histidine kinase n=1 Tax=Catenuloplanes niger TaxID=587534 RepID=A0AAE4CTV4_9ACTN|nr:HAMP domain-containing sensor histidine kinase [Catenuloplanes niger]MDR7325736.1 signal transduction histidine kinase [Catenuloplanes niger]